MERVDTRDAAQCLAGSRTPTQDSSEDPSSSAWHGVGAGAEEAGVDATSRVLGSPG
jgi:hypothetical protein